MSDDRVSTRLLALAALAFALFNYPLLSVFDVDAVVLGVPLVWLYLFGCWAVLIVLVGLTVRGK
jgi:hypothetical protein